MKLRSTSGVKMNWPLVAIAFAVIAVPMGVAVIQDLGSDQDDEEILAKLGQIDEITADEEGEEEEEAAAQLENADDIAERWHAMDHAFFDHVFLGAPELGVPALRGPFASVRWGQTEDEMSAASPELAAWMNGSPPALLARAEVVLTVAPSSERIGSIGVRFPDDGSAARILGGRWGEPQPMLGIDGEVRRAWFSPEAGLRVLLHQQDGEALVVFSPYQPASDYIGQDGRFAFESYPVLGATPELLAVNYGSAFRLDPGGASARLDCPGIEGSNQASECVVAFGGGKALSITAVIDHALDAESAPAVFAALRERLGPVSDQASDQRENRWTFHRGITVTQKVGSHSISVKRLVR